MLVLGIIVDIWWLLALKTEKRISISKLITRAWKELNVAIHLNEKVRHPNFALQLLTFVKIPKWFQITNYKYRQIRNTERTYHTHFLFSIIISQRSFNSDPRTLAPFLYSWRLKLTTSCTPHCPFTSLSSNKACRPSTNTSKLLITPVYRLSSFP